MAGSARVPIEPLEAALSRLRRLPGGDTAVTAWEHFDQQAVSGYAALTGEDMWIHTDPVRAASSPFSGTIVQASLLMARFGTWLRACGFWLPEPAVPLNYGFDRVRILRGLPTGAAVRGRVKFHRVEDRPPTLRLYLDVSAECDDGGKPVIAAAWIVAFICPGYDRTGAALLRSAVDVVDDPDRREQPG